MSKDEIKRVHGIQPEERVAAWLFFFFIPWILPVPLVWDLWLILLLGYALVRWA